MRMILSLLLFVPLVAGDDTQDIYFYDDISSHKNLMHSSRITTSCENLPQKYWNKVGFMKNEKCVLLFSHPDCKGTSLRAEPGTKDLIQHFPKDLDSFRSCEDITRDSPYKDYRIQFYDHASYSQLLVDIPIKTGCENLPSFARNLAFSAKTEACVILYNNLDCAENSKQYRLEKGEYSRFAHLIDDVESFKPCDDNQIISPSEIKLSVDIFKFEIDAGDTTSASTTDLEMGSKQTFRNNGGATIKQKYSVTKEVTETVSVQRAVGNSYTHSYSVNRDSIYKYRRGFWFIHFQSKVTTALRNTYSTGRSSSIASTHTSETTKTFNVEQDIVLPPCREYSIVSTIKVKKNVPLSYIAHAFVTGDNKGRAMSASEIKEKLPNDMTYVKDKGDNSVEVEFTKTMTADFGLETETDGNGAPIEGCKGVCDFDEGLFQVSPDAGCTPCHKSCKTCHGFGDDKCVECANDGAKHEGICIESCPSNMKNVKGRCRPNCYPECLPVTEDPGDGDGTMTFIIAGVGVALLLVLGVVAGVAYFRMRGKKEEGNKRETKYMFVDGVAPAPDDYFANNPGKIP